jgi:hypothetical protein
LTFTKKMANDCEMFLQCPKFNCSAMAPATLAMNITPCFWVGHHQYHQIMFSVFDIRSFQLCIYFEIICFPAKWEHRKWIWLYYLGLFWQSFPPSYVHR